MRPLSKWRPVLAGTKWGFRGFIFRRNFFFRPLFERKHLTWEMNMNSVIYLVGLVVVVLAVLSLIGLR